MPSAEKNIQCLDFEKSYWELHRQSKPEKDLQPINSSEEETVFWEHYRKGKIYNPILKYAPAQHDDLFLRFKAFNQQVDCFPDAVANWYVALIKKQIEALHHYSRREAHGFPAWLMGLFGKPDADIERHARKIIHAVSVGQEPEAQTVSAKMAGDIFSNEIKESGYEGWNVVIGQNVAKVTVYSLNKIILLSDRATFSEQDIKRLKAHEIGVHVLRAVNGERQPYRIFSYGLPDYSETEEGLALLAENYTVGTQPQVIRKYAFRAVACSLTAEHGFHSILTTLVELGCDPLEAFSITMRVKRGMTDTSVPGGYTKDQIYLSGFLKLSKLGRQDIAPLFIGKIGLRDVASLRELGCDAPFVPEWLGQVPELQPVGENHVAV